MSKFCALKSAGMGNRLKIYVSYLARYDEVMVEKNEDRYRLDFKSDKPEKSEDSMLKFGDDDIDIPTFLRNSN